MLDTQQPLDVVASTAVIHRHSIAGLALRQTREEKWPQFLVGTLRLVKSTWSLSSSWSSDTPEPESECPIVRDTAPSTPPPSYSDPSHPWAAELQKELDEEEEEKLPAYECTVSRVGQVYVKRERENQTTVAKKRTWKNLYVILWGTSIRAYKREPKRGDERPLWSYTMQGAEAGMATDYRKYKHVLRIRTSDGPQFLMRCSDERSAVLWIDAVQASANVSPDLDTRPMPEFTFGRRRRNRRRT
ncbi:hypothetical protein BJV82DRAFT_608962 [Fennellomyces sp. T-0311]|nr:hypothetical protein BJV82DRAFT_608962 [Fennellomyces sp. T-0311]